MALELETIVEYTVVQDVLVKPNAAQIVRAGFCQIQDLQSRVEPGQRLIVGVRIDSDAYYVSGTTPVLRERMIPEEINLARGQMYRVAFPKGTRVSIKDNLANVYVATGDVEDGIVELMSQEAGSFTIIAVLPNEAFRYIQFQSVKVEIA